MDWISGVRTAHDWMFGPEKPGKGDASRQLAMALSAMPRSFGERAIGIEDLWRRIASQAVGQDPVMQKEINIQIENLGRLLERLERLGEQQVRRHHALAVPMSPRGGFDHGSPPPRHDRSTSP
jgi:hypothetical protein